jgi:hypothetical protein
LRSKPRNRRSDFEAQITKPVLLVLRLNQETHAPCLLMHGADHTQRYLTS